MIRQGLPSINEGEALRKNADYEFYVRDRAPAVRTTGRTYVLPRNGQQGLPLVSVNAEKLDIEVYSIGDRSLAATIQNGEFLSPIGSYGAEQIRDSKGVKVWSGTLDVKPVPNIDVTTAFPRASGGFDAEAGRACPHCQTACRAPGRIERLG